MAHLPGDRFQYNISRAPGEIDPNPIVGDVAFNRHSMNDGHHISPYDLGRVLVGCDDIEVRLVQGINEDDFKRTLSRAQRATIGVPLSDIIKTVHDDRNCGLETDEHGQTVSLIDSVKHPLSAMGKTWDMHEIAGKHYHLTPAVTTDWEEMLQGGLQTALETQTIIFEVFGVARAATHQIVRSRRAAFHQQSMRASFFGDHPDVRMPESVWRNKRAADAFMRAIRSAHEAYKIACDEDISYQDARYVLPIGTVTYIMCEYSVREFLALYAYRACSMFQWEIVNVVRQMGGILAAEYPWLAKYIKISCENVQRCTFQGWESVDDQCDLPWAQDANRTYKPVAHKIERKK